MDSPDESKDRRIRIGQLNVQGSNICTEELRHIVKERSIDVMLLQEPYSWRGKIPHIDGVRAYYVEGAPKAAILVYNSRIEVSFRRNLSDSHHVCVKLFTKDKSVDIINSYFQYSDPIDRYIKKWDKCLREIGNKELIIAGDVNAKSVMWYSCDTNIRGHTLEAFNRGKEIEEFIIEKGLLVCNEPGNLPTFAGAQAALGETNIDVTLAAACAKLETGRCSTRGTVTID